MNRCSQKGITLVELVVSVSLLAVIVLAALSTLDFGGKAFSSTRDQGDIQTQASYIAEVISSKVRESGSLSVSADGRRLFLPGAASFQWDGTDTLTYTDGASRTLSRNVSSLEFALIDDGGTRKGVEIRIELVHGEEHYKLATKVYQRF